MKNVLFFVIFHYIYTTTTTPREAIQSFNTAVWLGKEMYPKHVSGNKRTSEWVGMGGGGGGWRGEGTLTRETSRVFYVF